MENLIKQALTTCMDNLPQIDLYKTIYETVNIDCGNINEITKLVNKIALEYSIDVDKLDISADNYNLVVTIPQHFLKSDNEVENERIKFFNRRCYRYVYDLLICNGYKRVGFSSGLLKEFSNTNVYEMFMGKNYTMLIKYYELHFKRTL